MKIWHKLFAPVTALLLGALLTLSFAPFDVFPFAILAPAGLLALWMNASPQRSFWLGFLFGLGYFGTGVYWVFISIHNYGDAPAIPAAMIAVGLFAILSLYPAFTGYLLNRYFPAVTTQKLVYAFPALWVISEWLRSWIGTGFPWLLVGYSQTNSALRGYAPLLSVYGVSLAILLSSGLLVNAWRQYKQSQLKSTYLNLFAILCIFTLGGLLSLIPWTQPNGKPITVSLVQGNIPQELKWSPEHVDLSLTRYVDMTAPLWTKSKLIIWPEAAIPLPLSNVRELITDLNKKALDNHTNLFLGVPIQDPATHSYFNSIIALGKKDNLYQRYDKQRLVPFGEYTPFESISKRVFDFLNIPMSDMIPGNRFQPMIEIDNFKVLSFICYEIAYPELMDIRDPTIGLLLTITNDAWFDDSSAQPQHLQMAQMRAIEMGRPVLFVSNNGITAIINPHGQIEASAPPRETFVLNGTVQPTIGITPWMKNGIDPLTVTVVCLLFIARRSQRQTTFSENTI